MEIIKTVITTLDILLILLFFTFGKTAKDKPTAIGFGSMIMWLIINIPHVEMMQCLYMIKYLVSTSCHQF